MKCVYITIILLCAIVTVNVLAVESKEMIFDPSWYAMLQNNDAIARLQMFDSLKNKMVKGQGEIIKVEETGILKKKFRITLAVNLTKIKILIYCYTDKDDYSDLLQPGDTFEFSGQFVVATPLNTKVDTIICDIILEDGAVIVK
ncbi:MAG: hypothetical protein N3F66_08725 [Spirochaetes bacterium]|nr:hypothetical protein [Spirochaetota bacterium]